ncbi:MAG TPA: molybdenum cofactor cytidylyltransferase [Prolixibacteraceae bacterium]|nr:molybdenum cofactor cytidylyltransferase [Prolixibacteraceae bacterium]
MNDIWAIVLAAGMSTRMGTQKLLLPFAGMTMIEKVVENILNSGIENVLIVLGANRTEIEEILEFWPVQLTWNENFREGMHTSVIAGVNALPESAKAAAFFLGDQPLISPEVVVKVVEEWQNSGKGIVIPLYAGKRGHPPLYDLKFRNELQNLDPSVGLRSVAQRFQDEIIEVETECPGILKDIDTKEDYWRESGVE